MAPHEHIPWRIARLLTLYNLELLSPGLQEELNKWVNESEINKHYFEQATNLDFLRKQYSFLESVKNTIADKEQQALSKYKAKRAKVRRITFARLSIAASVLIVVTAGFLVYNTFIRTATNGVAAAAATTDIPPGGNKAKLTLANGKTVDMNEAGNGTLLKTEGCTITKTDGEIAYDNNGVIITSTPESHTISTPKGGTFRLKMGDGTRIWLNAASSVTFPAAINNFERRVAITGEVYFEVAELVSGGRKVPFIVDVLNKPITVEVLGTHFNINAYEDEPAVKATLLEGKVNIRTKNGKQTLTPGQQADIVDNDINVVVLDDSAIMAAKAWQQGYTNFAGTDLGTILRQIGRWYNVDVVYSNNVSQRQFNATISRSDSLSAIIDILKRSEITAILQGKKLVVN
jgi:transmembrane sensor